MAWTCEECSSPLAGSARDRMCLNVACSLHGRHVTSRPEPPHPEPSLALELHTWAKPE